MDIAQRLDDRDLHDVETFRKTKETAMLVMMFIDMVHSTSLREKLGEIQFERLRKEKKQILVQIIQRAGHGKVIKDLGDGLLSVFAIPDIAVRTALRIQEKLTSDSSFQVRIGLDMGQVTQESEGGIVRDVFGRHVNRAARLEALGEGGHVLVSYTLWDSAKGWLKHLEHIHWKKHGSYHLKGLSEPQIVYEPYNVTLCAALTDLHGKKVAADEELTYCQLCGRYVKLKETFACRRCGRAGICVQYCYDTSQRQCIECAATRSQVPPAHHSGIRENTPVPVQPDFDLFLCYSQADSAFVLHLAEYFTNEGLAVWLDEEQIDIGDPILETLTQGLHNSRFVVVCLSKYFHHSQWKRPDYQNLLAEFTREQNARVLPVIVGDYEEVDIPDYLYDKYYVDVRENQGIERLMRKLRPAAEAASSVSETDALSPEEIPAELQAELHELQGTLLRLSKSEQITDEIMVECDKVGLKLLHLLERFSAYFDGFYEFIAEYQHFAEHLLSVIDDREYRRALLFRFKKVEACIEDVAGGFNHGESFLAKNTADAAANSPYSFYEFEFDELEIEQGCQRLLSGNELDESEGIDWLLRGGFAHAETRLRKIAELNRHKEVFTVLWKRTPRLLLYYHQHFWDVLKYILARDPLPWKLRFFAVKSLFKRSLTVRHAEQIIHNFVPAEQEILSAFLMLHPKHECRQFALQTLPSEARWDMLLCPKIPWLIVKELVAKSCEDSSDSYIKAMFLVLRQRLLHVDSPLGIAEAYQIIQQLYHRPVFLEETFFHALIEVHTQLDHKAGEHPVTQQIVQECRQKFQAFCSQPRLKDVDITEMRHIPLPIQRKLAHDGFLPKYFICNVRNVIALETVPYVERRPDIIKFFRLRKINSQALDKLASNPHIMREQQHRSAFCHHPKANSVLLRTYLSTLTRREIRDISRDRNVNAYARELAAKYITRYQ